jgi:hypothetical protein
MIRALLAGEKTQMRRIVKPQPRMDHSPLVVDRFCPTVIDRYGDEQPGDEVFGVTTENGEWCLRCPYGQPGDTLWVRETWGAYPHMMGGVQGDSLRFRADGEYQNEQGTWRWRPSIHMPRWASRLTLRITDVRVERLQEISEDDARAEGVRHRRTGGVGMFFFGTEPARTTAARCYQQLWENIYGPDSWAANPYVWVIEFRRVGP